MKKRIKKKDHENLSSSNIEKVIALLSPEEGKPITKKAACEVLNISYNTTRLNSIIEDHIEQKAYVKKRKQQNRGTKATDIEISDAVTMYLKGEPVSDIAKYLFRPPTFVKSILERVGVPSRPSSAEEKAGIDIIPDKCIGDQFTEGEIAWSAVYHKTVQVGNEMSLSFQEGKKGLQVVDYEEKYGSKVYQVYVTEPVDTEGSLFPGVEAGGFFAYSTAYDLGKLTHLQEYGVNLRELSKNIS